MLKRKDESVMLLTKVVTVLYGNTVMFVIKSVSMMTLTFDLYVGGRGIHSEFYSEFLSCSI